MSKPGGDPSPGISSGDALILPERRPACRRREARPGSCTATGRLSRSDPAPISPQYEHLNSPCRAPSSRRAGTRTKSRSAATKHHRPGSRISRGGTNHAFGFVHIRPGRCRRSYLGSRRGRRRGENLSFQVLARICSNTVTRRNRCSAANGQSVPGAAVSSLRRASKSCQPLRENRAAVRP
jgi:hypothetical protein